MTEQVVDESVPLNEQDTVSSKDLRRFPRKVLRNPLLGIPILPDGSPDWEHRRVGAAVDVSQGGMGIELECGENLDATGMVVVVQGPAGPVGCAGLEFRHARRIGPGRIQVGGQFGGLAHEILRPENLVPAFHAASLEMSLGLPRELLEQWERIGILTSFLYDRVQLCPKCRALPTFRQGCPSCGSARLGNQKLIHHYACAHVGLVANFESTGGLVCPKCRTRRLVVGADYEYLTGPYQCLDCHWSDSELEQVGQCLRCGFRFPGRKAHVEELRAYRVNQLDPLALLAAPGSTAGFPARAAADRHAPLRAEQAAPMPVGLR
jgi:hypothetical protein